MGSLAPHRKPGRPRDPDLEARRRVEILTVAAKVFAEHGFAATDVQVIADQLNVGKGTVYRYFRTKEALFLATVETGLRELSATIDPLVADETAEPMVQVAAAIRAYLGFFARRPEMAELFIQERAAFPLHHRPLYFSIKTDDERECAHGKLFERLVASGKLRPIPQERFFSVVGDLLYGTILTNLLTDRPADPDAQAEDILDMIFHGALTTAGRNAARRMKR